MHRYQMIIEYDGTNFLGWQVQKKGKTVQGFIQQKISKLLGQKLLCLDRAELMQESMPLHNLHISIVKIKLIP